MRILRGDLLRIHCRAPLDQISVIDLRRCGVESLNPQNEGDQGEEQHNKTTLRVIVDEQTTAHEQNQDSSSRREVPTKTKNTLVAVTTIAAGATSTTGCSSKMT
jgi:hypothetical protein